MLVQSDVDKWLNEFLKGLFNLFGERLVFAAHHGSWARGEARPDSDIDVFVVLDQIDKVDLSVYKKLVCSMSDDKCPVSTFLGSMDELRVWPRYELIQCWYGIKVLHGTLDNLVEKPGNDDFIEDIRVKATTNLHAARHYMLHPHDLEVVVHRLYYPFKECFYAMQSWLLLTTGKYYPRKVEMLAVLPDSDDKEIVRVAKDWHELSQNRVERPEHYICLLERWCRKMLDRIVE